MRSLTLLLIIFISLSAQAQSRRKIEREMNSWMGSSKKELIFNYGPVSAIADDGDGGEILIFSSRFSRDNPSLVDDGYGNLVVKQGMRYQYYRHRMFYVGRDGKAYAWKYQDNEIPPQQMQIQINGTIDVYKHQ